jgi:hypothetical protein
MRGPRLSLPRRNPTRAEDVIGVDESTAMPESMPELDQLMSALFLVALLLYLIAVFGLGISAEWRRLRHCRQDLKFTAPRARVPWLSESPLSIIELFGPAAVAAASARSSEPGAGYGFVWPPTYARLLRRSLPNTKRIVSINSNCSFARCATERQGGEATNVLMAWILSVH